jgi:hypothetical protein
MSDPAVYRPDPGGSPLASSGGSKVKSVLTLGVVVVLAAGSAVALAGCAAPGRGVDSPFGSTPAPPQPHSRDDQMYDREMQSDGWLSAATNLHYREQIASPGTCAGQVCGEIDAIARDGCPGGIAVKGVFEALGVPVGVFSGASGSAAPGATVAVSFADYSSHADALRVTAVACGPS